MLSFVTLCNKFLAGVPEEDYSISNSNRKIAGVVRSHSFSSFTVAKMGIQGLMKLLSEECPGAIKEQEVKLEYSLYVPLKDFVD